MSVTHPFLLCGRNFANKDCCSASLKVKDETSEQITAASYSPFK